MASSLIRETTNCDIDYILVGGGNEAKQQWAAV